MTTSQDFEIVHAGGGPKRERARGAPKTQLVAVPLLELDTGNMGQSGGQFSDFENAPAEEVIAAPSFWCPHPHRTNCLRVRGTSMSPLIDDGDIVAVDGSQNNPAELDRKIVVACHRDHGLSVARFISADGVHLLESENREYGPIVLDRDRNWQIVGKVLWWIRKGP